MLCSSIFHKVFGSEFIGLRMVHGKIFDSIVQGLIWDYIVLVENASGFYLPYDDLPQPNNIFTFNKVKRAGLH